MRKFGKVVSIIIISIVVVVLVFLGGVFLSNQFALKKESKLIDTYGQQVAVDGKEMTVQVSGKGDETIVLLPGFMTASPIIDFTQLTAELENNYRVVVVEPFGYGESDDTTAERSLKKLTQEIHSALQSLNITSYHLMGHSIAGIYSLAYANDYATEVKSFIGLDSSIPAQGGAEDTTSKSINYLSKSGFFRLFSKLSPELISYPDVSAELKEQYRLLSLKNLGTKATLNEAVSMEENFDSASKLKYPTNLPVLYILASESVNDKEAPGWLEMHENMIANSDKAAIEVLEGEHYIHYTQSKEIAALVNHFIN